LRIKLPHLDQWNEQRRQNAALYNQLLGPLGVILPSENPQNRHVYHLYVIRTPHREALRQYLNEQGIGTGIHYPVPNHMQKVLSDFGAASVSLPVTEAIVDEILSLPMYAELRSEQVRRVVETIEMFYSQLAPR
jgi:dTDP-4-amino-4,6-dideoxygalactose transaminase